MIELCLITPPAHVELTGLLPGRFCLAQVAMQDATYMDYFCEASKMGYEVVLDNGAFEEELVSDEEFIKVAQEVKPRVLVIPDILGGDAEENLQRAYAFTAGILGTTITRMGWELMFVPQCEPGDIKGFARVLRKAMEPGDFNWIGIARKACCNAFSHITRTDDESLNKFFFGCWAEMAGIFETARKRGIRFHMLGIGDHLWMLQHCGWCERADTSSFFSQAAIGNVVCMGTLKTEVHRPKDYFKRSYTGDVAFISILRRNCVEAQKYVQ